LIESGAVTKGFLGINFPISDDLNTSRLDRAAHRGNGVVVTGVMDGTPAEVAGVRVGDIIVRLNEREVLGIAALRSMIATTRPGEQVRLRIVRDGKGRDVTVKLADRDEGQKQLAEMRGALDRFGLRRYSSVDAGVQLDVVREGSDADKAGLAPGQVVTAVDGAPVQGTDVLFSKLRAGGFLDGREVTLTVSPEADDDGERGAATEVKVRLATRK
jgi:serine protease Do/serine protease DegQ